MGSSVRRAACLLFLFLGTLLLYRESAQLDFLTYDDDTYVTSNAMVRQGLSAAGLRWAFASDAYACNWHPLTWISHMADVSLYGLENPGGHHMTNVIIHGLNALLLVTLLLSLSGRFVSSWFVGALFAWHPQRVESVAWISERKDVLAMFFGLLSLLAFYRWAQANPEGRKRATYLLACTLFACGLMAKPLLVTLPVCMLLLDRWPAARGLDWRTAILEKLPFFALSALACGMTLWSQSSGGCTQFIADGLPLMARLQNAAIVPWQYLGSMLYPKDLVVFYPHPAVLNPADSRIALALVCSLGLALALAIGWRMRRRAPYLLMGMLWFLVVLFPMLGIVQVGGQAMADRYTYFSTIGLSLSIAFGAAELARLHAKLKLPLLSAGVISLGLYACATHSQIPLWKNDLTLFGHAAEVDERNYIAQNALGTQAAVAAQQTLIAGEAQAGQALLQRAITHLSLACASNPEHFEGRVDLGAAQILAGDFDAALENLLHAAQLRPADDHAQFQLALAHYNLNQLEQADDCLATIKERNPSYPKLDRLIKAIQDTRDRRAANGQGQ